MKGSWIMAAKTSLVGLVCLAMAVMAGVNVAEEYDREAFRKLYREFSERMRQDLAGAQKYLEEQIAAAPDSADLNALRHSLAMQYARERDYKRAHEQFGKLLDFQIKHIEQSENQFGVWTTVLSIKELTDKSRDWENFDDAVNRGFDALGSLGADVDPQPFTPRAELAVLKARQLVRDGKTEQATTIVASQASALSDVNASDQATEQAMLAQIRMLSLLTTADRENDSWRDQYIEELDEAVSKAIDRFPQSESLQNEYASVQLLMITRWGQDDPEATEKRIDDVMKKLDLLAAKNRAIRATLRRLQLRKERMAAVKPVESLVGKPAPEWEIDAWVNAVGIDRDSFKGKVVLVDFWAVWCGPCIATFPHLRQWREEFADQGFEIVGVTQYYNFQWDDEQKRASRAGQQVSPEQERETIASFLEHHDLHHPVMVTPKQSKMDSQYGVRGIPHVVLIDREGVVQLVKTGAGEETAKEIEAKIKELLGVEQQ